MPTIPQEISQSTQTLTDNATIVEQFAQGAANTFIPVRGGTLRPLLYWQGTFQNKVTELAQPYVDQLVQANQVADSKVQAASDSAAAANQSAQEAAASAASVDFPTRLAELNAQQTRLARSLSIIGDHGQSMHFDFLRQAFALGNLEGLNRTLSFAELFPDFTRESPKWVFDATGTLVEVGIDEPAFDHDPLTGEPLGPLIERSVTNRLLWSRSFGNSEWIRTRADIEENVALAPDGSMSADKLVASSVNGQHIVQQMLTLPANADQSLAIYVKAGEYSKVRIYTGNFGAWSTISTLSFDLANAQVISGNGGFEPLKDGWFRIWTTGVTGDGSAPNALSVSPMNDSGELDFAGNDVDGLYIWQADIIDGKEPSSPILTEGAPLARAADNLGRLMGDEYRQDEGTLVMSYSPPALSQGNTPFICSINAGTHNNSMSLVFHNSTLTAVNYAEMRADGFPVVYFGTGSTAFGPFEKNAIRYSPDGSLTLAKNGDLFTATGEPLSTLGLNNLILGGRRQSTANNINGHLHYLLYIPRAVSDGKIQELIA